jgi:protein-disulfide isomerase
MDRKRRSSRKRGINGGLFFAVTVGAVLVAVFLVLLGRAGIPTAAAGIDTLPPANTTASAVTPTLSRTPVMPVVPDNSTPAAPAIINTTKGSSTAPVTFVEYSDFQCSHCQEFALTIEPQLETAYIDTGKVYLIYKFVAGFGEESRQANLAAACAAEQDQFWPYYYLLMQQQASSRVGDLTVEILQGLARQLGLNLEKFNSSFLGGKFTALVDKDDADARASGVTGTPTFFINGIKQDGAENLQTLKNIIDPMLENRTK